MPPTRKNLRKNELKLVNLQKDDHVRSNWEPGPGRYDILLNPRDLSKTGFVFQFKQTDAHPQKAAQLAWEQIRINDYGAELRQSGVTTIRAVGVAMCGKEAAVDTAQIS